MVKSVDLFFTPNQKETVIENTNLIVSTPIEQINENFFVKREDLACPFPGPPFGKVRGLYPVLQKLKQEGIETVSYTDTSISMAGWGVSYFCKELGLKSVIFYPKYKEFRHNQEEYIKKWHEFGAEVIPLDKPNRQMINFYRARKILTEMYPNSIMLPQGLPFEETVENVANEIIKDEKSYKNIKSIVVSVGSGVMIAGIIKGICSLGLTPSIIGVFVAPKSYNSMLKKINKFAGKFYKNIILVETDYEYTDKEEIKTPFPCNPYYDAKAYRWAVERMDGISNPVLFWNTGA